MGETRRAYLHTDADMSECGRYRYSLSRRLSMGERAILFVGLNPSTADATQDDPTIRREVDYARRWGFDWYHKVNLYGFRSTDPKALLGLDDLEAVGPLNQDAITTWAQRAEVIICAWGAAKLHRYADQLAARLTQNPRARYLKLNADGSPAHPLYLKKTLTPQPYPGRAGEGTHD